MSTVEIKAEIKEELEKLSEKDLNNVLELINSIKTSSKTEKNYIDLIFNKVASRYDTVLKKLAQ
jgi:ribosome assembly protein YihI (activator of Der GTPase)